jgi:outer membrane receptor for ferrienterochelin and colicin
MSSSISSFKLFLSEQGANKIITRTNISLKPKMIITNKINAGIYFARIKNQMQPSFYLCDMQGQWKFGSSVRLTLTAHNLLNNRIFSDKEYNLFGYSEQRYILAARYLIVGLQLEF